MNKQRLGELRHEHVRGCPTCLTIMNVAWKTRAKDYPEMCPEFYKVGQPKAAPKSKERQGSE